MTKQRTLDPLLLMGVIIVFAAVSTWFLPAGKFERAKNVQTGRLMVVPGSYHKVPQTPVDPWGALTAIPQGLTEAAEIVFYVLLAGAALSVVEATGAIGNFLNRITWRFGEQPMIVLSLASILFLVGGAANSMYEEILAFLPVLCSLMRRLGLGNEVAVAISVGTATVASAFSPFNTFLLGISQPLAQLPLFSGFAFRMVTFVIALAIWGGYLAWFVRRTRGAAAVPVEAAETSHVAAFPLRARDILVLLILNGGMALIVSGGIFLHWDIPQFSAILIAVGFAAGLAGGLGWRGTSEHFAEGIRRIALACALIGFARAISVVLSRGQVLDTIANMLFSPLSHLPLGASAMMMVISQSVLAFPMPSDSGRAMMSLPVMLPLADLLGLSRQLVISAYEYGSIVSGLVTPSAGALLAMLALAKVSFGAWLRFVAIPVILLLSLCIITMAVGVRLGVQ
jgi:uncharacterized ion transporter superfamily protein YfcC